MNRPNPFYSHSNRWIQRICEQNKPLSRVDELALFAELKDDPTNQTIKNKITLHNLGLVLKLALPYFNDHRIEMDDLIGMGVIGLIKAIDKYDPSRSKFSTYAAWWIVNELNIGKQKYTDIVNISRPVKQKYFKAVREGAPLDNQLKKVREAINPDYFGDYASWDDHYTESDELVEQVDEWRVKEKIKAIHKRYGYLGRQKVKEHFSLAI